jgi:dihydroorotase
VQNNGVMTASASLVLKDVKLPDGRVVDVSIKKGIVKHIGAGLLFDQSIDCSNYLVLPAAIDMHVHMRGGSQSSKEDWNSGSKSALAGGVTLVVDQPNTIPPITTQSKFIERVNDAQAHSLCHFSINSGVTEHISFESMWKAGAMAFGEIFFAPSSYGEAIKVALLEKALAKISTLGALVTIHAERISPIPDQNLVSHNESRSIHGEALAVSNVNRCNQKNCRIHFCHLSSADSIDLAMGSVEVAPHHLFLSYENFDPQNTFGKVNPPLRTESERIKLWNRWSQIDVIASDHAPHTINEKQMPFVDAPSGIPGVETMVPMLVNKVLEKKISIRSVIEKTSTNPAVLLGIQSAGFNVGDRADFALYRKSPVRISADILQSKCGWTPYENQMAVFPELVLMDGVTVYQNGDFIKSLPRWFPGSGYSQ